MLINLSIIFSAILIILPIMLIVIFKSMLNLMLMTLHVQTTNYITTTNKIVSYFKYAIKWGFWQLKIFTQGEK